jgi:uncharacterized protein YdeI (YjbR/CyaY-like superfamily)
MKQNGPWQEELERIATILSKAPLESTVKWGAEVFTYKGRNVVSYGGFKHYFAIWFYNGVFLKDPYKVLVSAQEGRTKSLRQWRFTSLDEVDERKILAYVHEAIEVEEKGLRVKPEKHQPVPLPALLAEELHRDRRLKAAFEQLSSGKQKEYCLYISEAKQEPTRQRRLEKIRPMILQGVGLNDKYK